MTKLYRVILPVTDIERAATCYTQLLCSRGQRVSPGRHYFECGGTILACYDAAADGDRPREGWRPHPNQYLYFSVPDLAAALERASLAGCKIDSAIARMPWGETLFYARDPFENLICFVDEATVFTGH